MIDRKDLQAKWVLGWALVKRLLLTLIPGLRDRGPRPWLARLRREALTPTPVASWARLAPASRCIGCGLCDLVGALGDAPSRWIMGWARDPRDAPLARDTAARLRALAPDIAAICPARLSAGDVADLIDANARQLVP